MGPLMTRLTALQDDLRRTSDDARMKKEGSAAAMAETLAMATYQDFLRDTARDFEIAFGAAAESPGSLDGIVRKVAEALADRLDFDAVKSLADDESKKLQGVRHEAENLRQEVKELRAMVERLTFLDEQRGKRVVA